MVALLAHGLNLRPARMAAIEAALLRRGATCGMMTLPGHGGTADDAGEVKTSPADNSGGWSGLLRLTPEVVLPEARAALKEVERAKDSLGLSRALFVGISMGALAVLTALAEADTAETAAGRRRQGNEGRQSNPPVIEKALLLSPAIALRHRTKALLAPVAVLPDPTPTPSLSRRRDRVSAWLPVRAYRTLIALCRRFETAVEERPLTLPMRIYLDPHDEFLSEAGIRRLIRIGALPNATVVLPPKDGERADVGDAMARREPSEQRQGSAHLLIDRWTMGTTMWADLLQAIE